MDKRFLYYFLKSLRSLRFLLPRKMKKFIPYKVISIALLLLFLWFAFSRLEIPDVSTIFRTVELPKENSVAHLYSNESKQNLKSTYLEAIYSAKKSILVIIYSLRDPAIINALQTQSRHGVQVTVISDPEASKNIKNQLKPPAKVYHQESEGLMHLKLMVIDQNQVWMGSANLTGDSLKRHGNLVVGINSPALANSIQQLADSMINPSIKPPSSITLQLPEQKIELWFLPTAGKPAFHRLMNLLYQAKTSIRLAMFNLTHPRLTDAIIDAHERGVTVQVILDHDQALEDSSSVAAYRKLLEADINVGLSNSDGLLHYKMAWIDENILVNGSANWTISAFKRNHDCFMVIDPLNALQRQEMHSLWNTISSEATFESPVSPIHR
jgi:phosphatidylserine/phosphatidylglycerophosphate/cardiolipin synthase-like enzyme